MTAATVEAPARYHFKPGPYSSHALLLREFPPQGDGRRVLDVGCAGGYLAEILAQRGFSVVGIDVPGTVRLRRRARTSARTRAIAARMPGAAGARRRAHRLAAQQRPCLFSRARAAGALPAARSRVVRSHPRAILQVAWLGGSAGPRRVHHRGATLFGCAGWAGAAEVARLNLGARSGASLL